MTEPVTCARPGVYSRILVATDLEAETPPMLAAALAPFLSAETILAVCHVRWNAERYLRPVERTDERAVFDTGARARLEAWSATFLPSVPRELVLEPSSTATNGISRVAERWGAELLVLAGSGTSHFWQNLIGSVPDQAVRHSVADVLVARPSPPTAVILAATDLTDPSFAAIAAAAAAARQPDASLVVIHVVEGATLPFDAGGRNATADQRRVGAESWVEHAMAKTSARGHVEIREGVAAREIVERAGALGASLVVVASSGRSGLKRALLGSVAEEVTRSAPCSVLVVRR